MPKLISSHLHDIHNLKMKNIQALAMSFPLWRPHISATGQRQPPPGAEGGSHGRPHIYIYIYIYIYIQLIIYIYIYREREKEIDIHIYIYIYMFIYIYIYIYTSTGRPRETKGRPREATGGPQAGKKGGTRLSRACDLRVA